jgi:TonB family protein
MKFKLALVFSVLMHISIFAFVLVAPKMSQVDETTYYVDIIHLPAGPGGGPMTASPPARSSKPAAQGADTSRVETTPGGVKDLAVKRSPQSNLRYPDKEGKKRREDKEMFSVVRKSGTKKKTDDSADTSRPGGGKNVLATGITSGMDSGTGGPGWGGPGGGVNFPYAYYIETLRNKISTNWYTSLVSPGLRGKHVIIVYFRILRDGGIENLKFEKKSGVMSLDLSALRAVENAAPFAPLPADFASRFLVVHFKFEWGKQ